VLNSEGRCLSNEGEENANNDCCSFFEAKIITNGDRIRSMSDEELAKLFVYFKRRTTDKDVYGSILFKQIPFEGKQRAIEATIEELKKEFNNG
jgi:predicted HTH transcriptional regulator